MPYITRDEAKFIKIDQNVERLVDWLLSVPEHRRKGYVAYIVKFIGKWAFKGNYFGISTGTDAVRSALTELVKDLEEYKKQKKEVNGDV